MQISSMAKAFGAVLGNDFFLQCGGRPEGDEPYRRKRLAFEGSEAARYISACTSAVFQVLAHRRRSVVYTRDIAVAFSSVLCGGRAVYEVHKEPQGGVATWLFKRIVRSRRFRLVAISNALGRYFIEHFGLDDARLLVAHSAIFPEDYDALLDMPKQNVRSSLGLPPEGLLVVHTGSLYRGRGAELFEYVMGSSRDVLFVQVGGEPDDITYWKRYYLERGCTNIIFIERQPPDTVRRYQVAADLLFYMITTNTPTYWCCSPLKLFEYMASGTPILGSCIGSIREILTEDNAWCFSPERPDSIVTAIERFRRDRSLAVQKSATALHLARREYSWHSRAQRIINFCNEGSARNEVIL